MPDVMSGGTKTEPRHITDGVLPDYHYPSHEGLRFYRAVFEECRKYGILPPGKDVKVGTAVSVDESCDDPQKRYTTLHHQLVASAKAVQLAHSVDQRNMMHDTWPRCLSLYL